MRVSARDRRSASAFIRKHRVEIGPALSFDPEEPRVTAVEHVLAALGADLATGLMRLARRHGVELSDVEAAVEGWPEGPLAWLRVVGKEGTPSLARVRVRVYVTTDAGPPAAADPPAVEALWREVLATSPLANTLRGGVDLDLSVKTVM